MRLADKLPNDIIMLTRFANMLDPDIKPALPPVYVRDCISMEADGITPPDEIRTETEQWIAEQEQLQQRAQELNALVAQHLDTEMASGGLPGWIQQPWVAILNMPWSAELAQAIKDAEACLT